MDKKTKVLLIEDNPGDTRLIRELLNDVAGASFALEDVDCLSKGLSCLAQRDIDVILLDLSLPDSQGLDSLSRICTQAPNVPVVVLSGLSDEAVAINAVQEGAQDYLVKGSVGSALLVRSLHYAMERQHLRVALRESESHYRLLADNIADVIWTADLKGRISYVSPSIKNFLGYTVGEAVKLEMKDILTPDSAEQAKRLIRDQIALWNPWVHHTPLSLTLEQIHKDGSTLWADVRLSFLCNEKGHITGILGVTRDITDRKKAEEAISESETQYRSLVETASKAGLGITIVQNTKDKEAVFVFVNDEYCKISGYSREELLGRSSLDIIPPENLASIRERYERRQKGESPPSYYETTLLRKDGTRLPIEISVSVFTYRGKPATVSFFKDITERKKAEDTLRRSEERYRLLADNAVDVIWTIDIKGRINYVSPSAKHLFGYSVDEMMAMQIRELLTPASAEIARKVITEEMRMKTAVSQNSYCSLFLEHVRKDGSTFWTEVIMSFLRDEQGRITLIQGVTRDITERRKSEEALRESEERYRLLAENVKDIIWTRDMNLKLTYTSPSVLEMSGYSVDEVMSMSLEESLTPASLELIRPVLDKVRAGAEKGQGDLPDVVVLELDLLHKNGSIVPVEMKVNMLHDSEGRPLGFLGVTRDITERKKADNTLRQSEERYRELFENANDIIYTHDLTGNFTSINKAAERITGYALQEILKMNIVQVLAPGYRETARQMIEQKVKEGGETRYDLAIIAKDGHEVLLEVNTRIIYEDGKHVGVQGIARDITERKRMEEALRENEERFRTVFEGTGIGIALVGFDQEVLSINPAFEHTLGYSFEEFSKLTNSGYLHPDDAMVDAKLYMEMLKGKRDHYTLDKRYIRKDGQVIWGRQNLSVIRDAGGKPRYFIAMVEDITERKKADEALRESERRLKDAMVLGNSGYWEFDVDMQKLVWSDQTFRLFERDPSLGAPSVEEEAAYYSPEQAVKLSEYGQRAIEKRESIEYDFVTTLPSGKSAYMTGFMRPVSDYSGKVVKLFGVFHDITERKRIENALRQSEENLRMITDNAEDS